MKLEDAFSAAALSDAELAAKTGLSRPHISKVRRGKRRASPEAAEKLAAATGIPRDAFIFGERAA